MNNIYDPCTERITALLDFDWALVSPVDRVLLWLVGRLWRHPRTKCRVSGSDLGRFPITKKPEGLSEKGVGQWEVDKSWSAASTSRDLIQPSTIAGIDRLMAMKELEGLICPLQLGNEFMLNRMTEDEKEKSRAETKLKVVSWLEKWGSARG